MLSVNTSSSLTSAMVLGISTSIRILIAIAVFVFFIITVVILLLVLKIVKQYLFIHRPSKVEDIPHDGSVSSYGSADRDLMALEAQFAGKPPVVRSSERYFTSVA